MKQVVHFEGIACDDPDALAERIQVSGMQLLAPDEGRELGYYMNDQPIVVPTESRTATPKELEQVLAPPNAEAPVRIVHLPYAMGQIALATYRQNGYTFDPHAPDTELAPGIRGSFTAGRVDYGVRPTTTIDPDTAHPDTGEPIGTGAHRDIWPQGPHIKLLAGNLGPDARAHIFAPACNYEKVLEATGGATNRHFARYVSENPDALFYWVELHPPQATEYGEYEMVEAAVNLPVANLLHDGVVKAGEESRVFFARVTSIDTDVYPSIV